MIARSRDNPGGWQLAARGTRRADQYDDVGAQYQLPDARTG